MTCRSRESILTRASAIFLVLMVLFTFGCGPEGYREPITRFQASSTVVIASTRLYITQLNQVERNHYISSRLDQRAQIKLNELEEVQIFSHDGLKARLDALAQLASYGDLLSKLANSNAPERARAGAIGLGDALKNLTTTVDGLTGADDAAFKGAVGPVSKIIGAVIQLVLEQKIKDALNKAINDGEEPINNLIAVIRSDISNAYQRKRSSMSDMRVLFVDEYNREMLKGAAADAEKLKLFADRIRAHEDQWEVFATANPADGLDAMAAAHSALVKYAKSGQKVTDLASLVSAMEDFAARAKIIGQAVQELKEL